MGAALPGNSVRPPYPLHFTIAAALAAAIIIGGGGAEGPIRNGVLAALGCMLLFIVLSARSHSTDGKRKAADVATLAVALALPLLAIAQLVPLPPAIWQSLPGRDIALTSLNLVGAGDHWRPLTMDQEATSRSLGAMLLPLAIFLYTSRAEPVRRKQLLVVLVVAAFASGITGALQLALGHPEWLAFYDGPTVGAASGLFANPNHQALLMACSMVATAILSRTIDRDHRNRKAGRNVWLAWLGIGFFAIMTLGTGSRAGVILLAIGLPGTLLVALGKGSVLKWAAVLLGSLAIASAVILLYPGTNSLGIRESFRFGEDARYAYLPDILYTLEQYWSAGSGLGTFANVFAPNENLDLAQRGFLNHAHNDVLEWLIETGAAGAVWLACALLVIGWQVYRSLARSPGQQAPQLGAVLIVVLVALHSLADYPLRTASIAVVTALALGLATPLPRPSEQVAKPKPWRTITASLVGLLFAAELIRIHTARWAYRENDSALLMRVSPTSPGALAKTADAQLAAGNAANAEKAAAAAVVAHPLNPTALRLLAQAMEVQGKQAGAIWRQASVLGWRDSGTQLWAFRQALLEGDHQTAVLRADALMRTSVPQVRFLQLLRSTASERRVAEALAARMRLDPHWRNSFFRLDKGFSQAELRGLRQVIDAMISVGIEPRRADARALISHYLDKGQFSQAAAIDRLVVGERLTGSSLLDDGGFDRLSEDYANNSTPFDWQVAKGAGTSGNIETAPPSHLVVDTDGERTAMAAQRYIALPAGRYRLSLRARSDGEEAFRLRLLCPKASSVGEAVIPQSNSFQPMVVEFATPGSCPGVQLLVESLGGGWPASAEFDDFELLQIGPAPLLRPSRP